jgi:hypothetical protein
MAVHTVAIDVIDLTVPPLNHINIAVINQPNPVSNYDANGYEVSKLIQIPKYKITDSATGKVINGTNIYDYFPELNPGGGGGGGGGDSYTKAETDVLLQGKQDIEPGKGLSEEDYTYADKTKLEGIESGATNVTVDAMVSENSDNPVKSSGIYSYVNSSVATNTANFIGTFNSLAELEAYSGVVTNNDYAFVVGIDSAGNTTYSRYKYFSEDEEWRFEYVLNNSSYTAAEWDTIQSGLTAQDKTNYDAHISNTSNPHNVTKTQIGLGNVDNTSDANKPVSTATQTALDAKANKSETVSTVTYDDANHKLTKTINGSTTDVVILDTDPTASSTKPVTSGGTNTAINALDSSFIEVTPTDILTMWNYSSYVKTYIDYDDLSNCAIISGDPNSQKAYKNRKRCNLADNGTVNAWYGDPGYVEDGSNGQVMVYQPKFYYKVEPVELDGAAIKKCYYYFSDYPVQGFKLHPFFKNEAGKVVDHAFFSAYEGSLYSASLGQILGWDDKLAYDSSTTTAADFTTDKLCSVAGVQPISGNTHNLIIENAEKLANNRGAGWHIDNIFSSSANQMMLIVEYASANSQTVIGNGVAFGSDPDNTKNCSSLTGSTSSLGNSSGKAVSTIDYTNTAQTTNTKLAVSYRGVENLWGNIWKFIPGLNTVYSSSTLRAYIANNYSFKYTDTTGYTDLGFNLPTSSNYIKYFGYSSEFDWTFVPTVVPGTSDGVIGDYVYVPTSNGTRIALLGGSWDGGSNAGLFYWYLNFGSARRFRFISARLCYVPQN